MFEGAGGAQDQVVAIDALAEPGARAVDVGVAGAAAGALRFYLRV